MILLTRETQIAQDQYIYIYIYIYIWIPNGSDEIYLGFTFPDHEDEADQRGLDKLHLIE